MQGWERVRTLSMQRAQHHTTNLKGKKENSRRHKRKSRLDQQENIGFDLKTHKSLTITLRVTKIIPKRWREAQRFFGTEKSYSEKVQMSAYEQPKHHDWSMSNMQWHIQQRQCSGQRMHRVTLNFK